MPKQFANPEKCRGSNLIQATQELAATRSPGTLRLHAFDGSVAKELIVDYQPYPEIIRITAIGPSIPKVTLGLQIDDNLARTWPASVVWPDGEVLIKVDFFNRHLRFECNNTNAEPHVVVPQDSFWKRIEGHGEVPEEIIRVVRAIVAEIDPGPRGCAATAARCAKYAMKAIASGSLCALSLGIADDHCQEATERHCDWCTCKGYDCRVCD